MHRSPLRSWFALVVGLCGCSAARELTTNGDGGGSEDALAELERETGQTWRVRYHVDLHTPAFLEGRTPPLAATPADAEKAARAFLTRHRLLYQMTAPADELAATQSTTDELGMTHAHFQQRQGKIPVWNGELVVHFAADGALVRINGRYQPLAALPDAPARGADEAKAAAVSDARAARPEVDPNVFVARAPKLWLYPTSASDARLAWRVETDVEDLDHPMLLETFIDAGDGSVLHRSDTLAYLEGSGLGVFGDARRFPVGERRGSYWLEDDTHGAPPQKIYSGAGRTRLPGGEVKSDDPNRWDEAGDGHGSAVDAQVFVAASYDYFAKVHGRAGWDGRGKGVHATVHFGQGFASAFFNGRQLVFGDGDGDTMSPLAGALDLVAHEFTHGLVFHTARLRLEGEPGALQEAICDLFAAFIAHSNGALHPWRIGEAVYHPPGGARAIRDPRDPHSTKNPETMSEWVDTADDQGGIHLNSTIVAHAGYLMTDGPHGAGWDVAPRIWYRALTRYLTSRATFADAADATLAAAADLGAGEDETRRAWIAVGVLSE